MGPIKPIKIPPKPINHQYFIGSLNSYLTQSLKIKCINIEKEVISEKYDKKINKYGVKCGSSLESWEKSGWIVKEDPYGWFQWYCRFYKGRRMYDDERQINRWLKLAGPNGRFRRRLMNEIIKKGKKYDDPSVSPVIRQVLLHWGYELTREDFNKYKKSKR